MLGVYQTPITKRRRSRRIRGISGPAMDAEIWKNLPEDLCEAILARLPVLTLVRFRLMCKRWNQLLSSDNKSMAHQRSSVPQCQPWFYIISPCPSNDDTFVASMYEPSSNKWYRLTFPHDLPIDDKDDFHLVGSAGGLVCFMNFVNSRFYVHNPITGIFRELPKRSDRADESHCFPLGMISDKTSSVEGGYLVSVLDEYDFFCVYKSCNNSWARTWIINPDEDLIRRHWQYSQYKSHVLHSDGTLHLYVHELMQGSGIVFCDTGTGIWSKQVLLDFPGDGEVVSFHMAEYRGGIILVGVVVDEKETQQTLCIWVLQKMTMLWSLMDKMDIEYTGDLDVPIELHFYMNCYRVKDDMLMLTLNSRHDKLRHVVYNFSTREWIVDIPFFVPTVPGKNLEGTGFYPCPFALP